MKGRVFLDTNVLVYVYDADEPTKQALAAERVKSLVADGVAVVSTQVLQEFYVTVTRKLARPVPQDAAEQAVRELASLPVVAIDRPLVLAAIRTSREAHLSLWDALIISAAMTANCSMILSEDMQPGVKIDGLWVENPFSDL
jgi:predicted nucleic acid-binding protein